MKRAQIDLFSVPFSNSNEEMSWQFFKKNELWLFRFVYVDNLFFLVFIFLLREKLVSQSNITFGHN